MCLILFSYDNHPRYKLILAANRDEFYQRPTRSMSYWEHDETILAGRDLQGGGTWIGLSRSGRMAAVTNFRDPSSLKQKAPTRGGLVGDFLAGNQSPKSYLKDLKPKAGRFNGFNLLVGDTGALYHFSNRMNRISPLVSGLYGLSNNLLNTPWPKVVKGKKRLSELLGNGEAPDPEAVFDLMSDREKPEDALLPDTGVGIEWERFLSPLFISGKDYGTRCSTVVFWDRNGRIDIWERTFDPPVTTSSVQVTRHFVIQI